MANTKKKTSRRQTPKPKPLPPQTVIGLSCGIHERPFLHVETTYSGRRYERTEHVSRFVELICKDCQSAVDQLRELRRVMEMLRTPALPEMEAEDDHEEEM